MKVFLGILDLLCVVLLVFGIFNNFIFLLPAIYLIVKGGIFLFSGDFVSAIDVVSGAYSLFLFFGVSYFVLTFLVAIFLLQKGLLSLIR